MRVGFLGCDDTAAVLARGWDEPVLCADADLRRARGLAAQLGGHALTSYDAVARRAEIVLEASPLRGSPIPTPEAVSGGWPTLRVSSDVSEARCPR